MSDYIRRKDAVDAVKHAWAKGIEPSQYIESIEPADVVPYSIEPDGTLTVTVPKGTKRIGRILIEEVSVKFDEPESILGEMGRNPVQNDPDTVLMSLIDEIYEICRFAEPGSYGKIPGALITPGSIKGVFHDRKHFHMSISHVLHIGN